MKILVRTRIRLDDFKVCDAWQPHFVDDQVLSYGEVTQFYKGGYTYRAFRNDEFIEEIRDNYISEHLHEPKGRSKYFACPAFQLNGLFGYDELVFFNDAWVLYDKNVRAHSIYTLPRETVCKITEAANQSIERCAV